MIHLSSVELAAFRNPPQRCRATRDAYAEALIRLGRVDERIIVLDSDLARSTRTEAWAKEFPDRFLNCGIAEQNMVGVAAGLASVGFIPFATTYAIFIGRCFDQIRQSVAFAGENVKLVGSHGGFAASFDGGSHQGLEDLALMSVLPGMTVLSPLDHTDTLAAVELAARIVGPVYLRIQKEPAPDFTADGPPIAIGQTRQWGTGDDVALIGTGTRVHACLAAAARLQESGLSPRVLGVGVIKPFDTDAITETAVAVKRMIVVEEHMAQGGLYAATCVAASGTGCPVYPLAAIDRFGETGAWAELLHLFKMDADGIFATAYAKATQSRSASITEVR